MKWLIDCLWISVLTVMTKNKIMIFENNMIMIFFLLLIITVAVICDCGSPALPVDAEVYIKSDQFTKSLNSRYAENTELAARCTNTWEVDGGLTNKVIKCQQNAWNASIHRCAPELHRNSISHIVIIDRETDKILVNESDFSQRCVLWNSTKSQLLRIEFKDEVAFDLYGIQICNQNEVPYWLQLESMRPELNCRSSSVFYNIKYKCFEKYFHCDYKLFNDLKRRVINYVVTPTEKKPLKLCSYSVFTFKMYEPCGTPEKPLHSIVATYDNYSHFECEVGYKLSGNSIVRCGRQGKWLDSFPKCVPKTCRIPALNYSDPQIIIRYTNANNEIISFTNTESVVMSGTRAVLSCVNSEILDQNFIRRCSDGIWIGVQPICSVKPANSNNYKQSINMTIVVTLIIIFILIIILIAIFGIFVWRKLVKKNKNIGKSDDKSADRTGGIERYDDVIDSDYSNNCHYEYIGEEYDNGEMNCYEKIGFNENNTNNRMNDKANNEYTDIM